MSELVYARLKENLDSLKMRNTLEILDNYLERAIKDEFNLVTVLDHIFAEEANRFPARPWCNLAEQLNVRKPGIPRWTCFHADFRADFR